MSPSEQLEAVGSTARGELAATSDGAPRPGLWRRLWTGIRKFFSAGDRRAEPFDFTSFEFPRLDIDQTAEHLRLHELAEENGRHDIPRAEDEAFDAPQERIVQFMRGEVASISSRYETSLAALNQRIHDLDVPRHLRELEEVPERFKQQLDRHTEQVRQGLKRTQHASDVARREYEAYRSCNEIEREARYPESKFKSVALLIAIGVLEGAVNSVFFARGSDFGLVGGAVYALLLAGIDVLVVFSLGRVIAWLVARPWRYRLAATGALLAFFCWATGFNLAVGHVREALQAAPDTAMTAALESFRSSPLGLEQIDSWVLVAIGLVLSVFAMLDGLRWDDPQPGYGALHRRLVEAREELEHWERAWHEGAVPLRDAALQQTKDLLRDARGDLIALERTIETKALLMTNVRNFARHYEESCNALIRLYRDQNLRFRSTPPPAYFARSWKLELSDRLSDTCEADRERLRKARSAGSRADGAAQVARTKVQEVFVAGARKLAEGNRG